MTLTNLSGVTDVAFTLTYNPALLIITGTVPARPARTLPFQSPPLARPISTSLTDCGGQRRHRNAWPDRCQRAYWHDQQLSGAKNLLHFSNLSSINSGAVTGVTNDAVDVNAYLGDVIAQGRFDHPGSTDISRVATLQDTGFAAFPLLDPTIVGAIRRNPPAKASRRPPMLRWLLTTPAVPQNG